MGLFGKTWNKFHVGIFIDACKYGDEGQVISMLKKEPDLAYLNDKMGVSALFHAVANGHNKIVAMLLEITNQPNDIEPEKAFTPLLVAATGGHIAIVRELLNYGANPNIQNLDGLTALHKAVYENQFDIAALLLTAGADPNIIDRLGNTPRDLAKRGRNPKLVELLNRDLEKEQISIIDFVKILASWATNLASIREKVELSIFPEDVKKTLRNEIIYLQIFSIEMSIDFCCTSVLKNRIMEKFYELLFLVFEEMQAHTKSDQSLRGIIKDGLDRTMGRYWIAVNDNECQGDPPRSVGKAFSVFCEHPNDYDIITLGAELFDMYMKNITKLTNKYTIQA